MADFDRERALDIIKNGTEAEQQRLIDEIAKQLDTKRYGLVWEHGGNGEGSVFDTEDVVKDYDTKIPVPHARLDLSLNIDHTNGNMLLEGDNYIWLKMLEQTHAGKIDVIYIDPPVQHGEQGL